MKRTPTQKVPSNELGYFALHPHGKPLSQKAVGLIISGPLTAMQDKLNAELAKLEVERPSRVNRERITDAELQSAAEKRVLDY